MSGGFIDVYLPASVWGYPCNASPRWSTTIGRSDSGSEQRNQNRMHPRHVYNLPEAIRDHETVEEVRDHWMITAGPFRSFPFLDPLDFASVRLEQANTVPDISGTDQVIGTGNGARTQFRLSKTYTRQGFSYVRPIELPIVSTVAVTIDNAAPPMGWNVTREGGLITFDSAPANGEIIRAGYLFDVPVRFESDEALDGIVRTFQTTGYAALALMETDLC